MGETGSTLFSGRLFWRQLKFGGNWLHIIFGRIVFEAAQIWREMAPHFFPADCFGGGSDLAGTGSTLSSDGLFWRQLRFGGKWRHIIFRWIVLEAAQIWQELAPHYFPADCFGGVSDLGELAPHYFPVDCFGGSSDFAGTSSTLFSGRLFWRPVRFGGKWLHTAAEMT